MVPCSISEDSSKRPGSVRRMTLFAVVKIANYRDLFLPLANSTTYGKMTALAVIKQLKFQSQKDTKQLAEAKKIAF